MNTKHYFLAIGLLIGNIGISQIMTSEGGSISLTTGGIMHCNGGVELNNGSALTNNGSLTVSKNSSLPQAGDLSINSGTIVNGDGTYQVEQDWINSATFNAGSSNVILYGSTQQYITSTNGTETTFNKLTLTGTGSGVNRKKTLQGVDAYIGTTGQLVINNRELDTDVNDFIVLNPSNTSVSNSLTFGAEGFVSSIGDGYLIRHTDQSTTYSFPVGSSEGTLRYRPVTIRPNSTSDQVFAVRMNNYLADNDGFFIANHEDDIDNLQSYFYHSIEQQSGSSDADLSVQYLPSNDGEWIGIAQWANGESIWKNIVETTNSSAGNYSLVTKSNWDFTDPSYPYILVNIIDELVIPNVFTPNNDGTNDTYSITSKGMQEWNLTIVNRWGNVVFETTDPEMSWDGKVNGESCEDGTYFYLLKAKSTSKEYSKQGHLTKISN